MAGKRGRLWVGTSGYQYDSWRGVFYPDGLKPAAWLPYYARHFDTVEINNTFYHLPRAEVFTAWRAQVPPGFLFALKFSRFGSHMKKLKDPEQTIGLYLERAAGLGRRLGPVLVQLPPRWGADPERLAAFLRAAPRRVRWAVEFRDPSWYCEPVFRALKQHRAALCLHDKDPRPPWRLTAGWTYLRFHGAVNRGNYPADVLADYAERVGPLLEAGRDVYAYFNNDWHGYAVRNALDFRALLEAPAPALAGNAH